VAKGGRVLFVGTKIFVDQNASTANSEHLAHAAIYKLVIVAVFSFFPK
jgi:hypothetical protein